MRVLPIAVALGLLVMAPILAVGQSAKMDGREQNVAGPDVASCAIGQNARRD